MSDRTLTVGWNRPVSDGERQLSNHVMLWGSDGYPVRKQGSKWVWGDAFGVKGPPTVFRTKREAVASFETFLEMIHDGLARESYERALRESQSTTT